MESLWCESFVGYSSAPNGAKRRLLTRSSVAAYRFPGLAHLADAGHR